MLFHPFQCLRSVLGHTMNVHIVACENEEERLRGSHLASALRLVTRCVLRISHVLLLSFVRNVGSEVAAMIMPVAARIVNYSSGRTASILACGIPSYVSWDTRSLASSPIHSLMLMDFPPLAPTASMNFFIAKRARGRLSGLSRM